MARYGMQQRQYGKEQQISRSNGQGSYKPVIDLTRCSGCGECEYVCSNGVFEMHTLSEEEKQRLPFHTRIRLLSHGNRQSLAARPNLCEGCGACVSCCRKRAIEIR